MSMPSETTATYDGRFSDGSTAATAPAAVRLTPQGIEIAPRGGEAPQAWPYGGLAAASPVGKGAGDVLLSHASAPGATLFVADRAFVAALTERASHLSAASQRWRFARPLLAICAVIVLVVAGLWIADVSPARTVARLLPTDFRQSLGRQVIASLSERRGNCHTPEGTAALRRLTERLSAAANGKLFDVGVLNWNVVNAFAAPGEQIILTRGLIQQAKSPDEVAGVLAHEMGHGLELHPEAGLIRAIGLSAVVELMLGGSPTPLANIGVLLAHLGYSRAAEREADAHALRLLEKTKISPLGIAAFFKRLDKRDGSSADGPSAIDKVSSILRSHPLSAERARLAASRPTYPTTPALSGAEWQALRSICGQLPKPESGSGGSAPATGR
jgi:Zn-dependent protease with chaperone function